MGLLAGAQLPGPRPDRGERSQGSHPGIGPRGSRRPEGRAKPSSGSALLTCGICIAFPCRCASGVECPGAHLPGMEPRITRDSDYRRPVGAAVLHRNRCGWCSRDNGTRRWGTPPDRFMTFQIAVSDCDCASRAEIRFDRDAKAFGPVAHRAGADWRRHLCESCGTVFISCEAAISSRLWIEVSDPMTVVAALRDQAAERVAIALAALPSVGPPAVRITDIWSTRISGETRGAPNRRRIGPLFFVPSSLAQVGPTR